MDCRHNILINNSYLLLMIHTKGDYNYKSQISIGEWLGLWRYELTLKRKTKPWITINSECKSGLKITNFIYRVKNKIKCLIGKHSYIIDDKCYHCASKKRGT